MLLLCDRCAQTGVGGKVTVSPGWAGLGLLYSLHRISWLRICSLITSRVTRCYSEFVAFLMSVLVSSVQTS